MTFALARFNISLCKGRRPSRKLIFLYLDAERR
nr:MAG TPA: hypothetical protein [Caudoviricetes sp.]